MPKHKYLEPPSRNDLKNNLIKLLKFHNIQYSMPKLIHIPKKRVKIS